ncbi:hypothetical protein [Streptomyces lateritius]|uniref:hypothetical protein n=1 Tax=Streptomyces lateritius TaxID=67313 RepID=UPI001675E022|nr:hypothetical protein [Streptomyces lateritius]GGU11425.1 hypothetical protein GCM10010272_65820 [Streptomyces lateritius]
MDTPSLDDLGDDVWIEAGQTVSSPDELREYIAHLRTVAHHMHTGLTRAAWGALQGQAWGERAIEEQPLSEDILEAFSMTITPSGMAAKDAVYRQSIGTLLATLEAVDQATLTAWLAQINAADPDRKA